MNITVAGEKKEVKDGLTVAQLVIDEKVETPEYVTVTINDEFVESGAFESTAFENKIKNIPNKSRRHTIYAAISDFFEMLSFKYIFETMFFKALGEIPVFPETFFKEEPCAIISATEYS